MRDINIYEQITKTKTHVYDPNYKRNTRNTVILLKRHKIMQVALRVFLAYRMGKTLV